MKSTSDLIYEHYESRKESIRGYLGMSSIGATCERKLWLRFRMAFKEKFSGRLLRLFDTGHREEARIIHELREIGCTVTSIDKSTGKQYAASDFGGHFRGHCDAVVKGLPEYPKDHVLTDVKTIKSKKFDELLKSNIKKMYPEYYAQGQCYMHYFNLKIALFIFVCKDDDRIHLVLFEYDEADAKKYIDKAERIIFSERMPAPISTDPTWFECGWCAAKDICHGSKLTKEVNCRTCSNSTAMQDGTWHCSQYDATIPDLEAQIAGCDAHILHPDLVPWKHKVENDQVIWITPDGDIPNGMKSETVFTSREIVANPKACASPDEFIKTLRNEMDGSIF